LHIEDIVNWIEGAFGPEPAPAAGIAEHVKVQSVLKGVEYQRYLQDLVNRQIIRDYLTNAILLGFISEDRLAAFARQIATRDGRAALSLHMLMSSVEDANHLAFSDEIQVLESLKPVPGSPPHMTLVPN